MVVEYEGKSNGNNWCIRVQIPPSALEIEMEYLYEDIAYAYWRTYNWMTGLNWDV